MPDIDSPSLPSGSCRDYRRSQETFPQGNNGGNGDPKKTVRASVDARVLQLSLREARRKPGDESSLIPAGEVFVPTWGPEDFDDEEDDD